jgi:hypothetical protein
MNKPWFDPTTGLLLFDEYVAEMPSFKKIMADQVITDEEFFQQASHVAGLFKDLETRLAPAEAVLVTEALCELAVLNALQFRRSSALL